MRRLYQALLLKIIVICQRRTLRTLVSSHHGLAIRNDAQSRNSRRIGSTRQGTIAKEAGAISSPMSLCGGLEIRTRRIIQRTLIRVKLPFNYHS